MTQQCGFRAWLLNSKTGNMSQANLHCKSWKCPHCRERLLKPKWKSHLKQIFGELECVYRTTCSEGEWAHKLYHRLYRREARYVKVRGVSYYTIYSAKPLSQSSDKLDCARAIEWALSEIQDADHGKRTVSTSHDWKLTVPKEKTHKLLAVGGKRSSDKSLLVAAAHLGLKVRKWTPSSGSVVQSGIEVQTKGYSEESIKEFVDAVKALESPEEYYSTLCYKNSSNVTSGVDYSHDPCGVPAPEVLLSSRWCELELRLAG